ncbi:hypothetical protein PT974_05216 [Cladobotryum mycophilum]|uniref:ATPase AAA-type core domain-containing protein n=1 Tax=Cladobotryum mycophilum TaxID=491253 RepID=A0ABR0SJ86_9HYPO
MNEVQLDMPPFIYINGYPGVGKLTVAKELCRLLPKAKVVDNHLLIDPAAAVFDRTAEEYQPLRQVLRREVLTSIADAKSTRDVTWIFTDQQSSSKLGSSSARDYQNAATVRGSLFISVILHCELNLGILRSIRECEDVFHFKDEYELQLDVTYLSPSEAARKIYDHIQKHSACPKVDA